MVAFRSVITKQIIPLKRELEAQQKTLGATFTSTPKQHIELDDEHRMRIGWRIVLTLLLLLIVFILNLLAGPYSKADAAALYTPSEKFRTTSTLGDIVQNFSGQVYSTGNSQQQLPLHQNGDSLVLAYYYSWFDQNTWTYEKLSDLPTEPYVSADRATMARHIEQAKQAGIDAFVVAWYGPNANQTEPNLTALLEEAAARNFKIAILFETDSPFIDGLNGVAAALHHAIATHINHPAYLRVSNRPVTFFWRPTIYTIDSWSSIRNQVDPNRSSIWIAEGVDTSYLSVFDGHHLYSNTWNPPADLTAINQKFATLVAEARQSFGAKFWVSTVMPGYNDTRIRANGFAQDRQNGAYYERSWQAAINSNPNWIIVTSFNEWPEGTYIEPSAAYGDQYLQLTATWSRRFKARQSQPVSLPATTPTETTLPSPFISSPSIDVGSLLLVNVPLLNLRSQPNTAATILTELPQNMQLTAVGSQPQWVQVQVNGQDQSGWVYATMVRQVDGSLATTNDSNTIAASAVDSKIIAGENASDSSPSGAVVDATATGASGSITATDTVTVNVNLLNVRAAPSTTATVIRILGKGATLPLIGRSAGQEATAQGGWLQIQLGSQSGWVYAPMVTITATP